MEMSKQHVLLSLIAFGGFSVFVTISLTSNKSHLFYSTPPRRNIAMPEVVTRHCDFVLSRQQRKKARTITSTTVGIPPWLELMNDTSPNAWNLTDHANHNLYLMASNNGGRLGNQMFTYATLFGIAWRYRRIPIWQKNRMQLGAFFNTSIRQQTFQVCHTITTICSTFKLNLFHVTALNQVGHVIIIIIIIIIMCARGGY